MKVRFRRFAVLLLALAASLTIASPAMAKGGAGGGGGGGGGGGAGCATFQSQTNTLVTPTTGAPYVSMTFAVYNGCVDEFGASRAMINEDFYDTATGKWLGGFGQGLNLGLHYFTYGVAYGPVETAPAQTITISLSRINGQVQDSRTWTIAQILQSVQPAA